MFISPVEGEVIASHCRKEGLAGLADVSEMLKDEGNVCEKVLKGLTKLNMIIGHVSLVGTSPSEGHVTYRLIHMYSLYYPQAPTGHLHNFL